MVCSTSQNDRILPRNTHFRLRGGILILGRSLLFVRSHARQHHFRLGTREACDFRLRRTAEPSRETRAFDFEVRYHFLVGTCSCEKPRAKTPHPICPPIVPLMLIDQLVRSIRKIDSEGLRLQWASRLETTNVFVFLSLTNLQQEARSHALPYSWCPEPNM